MEDGSEDKKAKGTKKCLIKRELIFENCKDSLFIDEIMLKLQQKFKSHYHNLYTEETNKIAVSSNDNKRLQTFDKITMYLYGINAMKVCESEIMILRDYFVENYDDGPFYDEIILQERKYNGSILMITQMKTKQNRIRIGHVFQVIHTEY